MYGWMWELDYEECWVPKNWCFWTVVLEKTLESPFYCKKIQPVNPKGSQSWRVIGRTNAEAEAPILWPPDVKNWLTGKDLDAGKDWRWEEKGKTDDEMVGWDPWLDGHGFEQALSIGDGQGSLACCSPWGSQKTGHNWATEPNWNKTLKPGLILLLYFPQNKHTLMKIIKSQIAEELYKVTQYYQHWNTALLV